MTPADGVDPNLLMQRADMALYRAKENGRARFAFFDPEMEFRARERVSLERDLRSAVRSDQIIPYFQPVVQLKTGQVSCYEVLARWPHAERGLVPPDQFIKIAIDTDLIGTLTTNLLCRACRETLHWVGAPRIALNIASGQLLDDALPKKLLKVLFECGFPPGRLEIEITEDALISDIKTAKATLTSLKHLGIRIALDDFGSGYSSLQHLRELPFDILKIDRSFVRLMHEGKDGLVVIKAILQLARSLGLIVTAEGIETKQQALTLLEHGCEQGQGFHLGKPLPGIGSKTAESDPTLNTTSAAQRPASFVRDRVS